MDTETSKRLRAQWFDGHSARRTSVELVVAGTVVEVCALPHEAAPADAADAGVPPPVLAQVPLAQVQVSERVGNTPYRLSFPDGALAVTADHAAVEAAFHLAPSAHWLARMERASGFVVLAIVGLGVALYFAWQSLIPKAAEAVAHRIPREAEKSLGTIALQSLDRWLLRTSRLDAGELAAARKVFDSLAARAALSDAVELQFRDTAPNALALPGGTIVVTDGLVKLFRADERLLAAVIAHELGHVHHRHSLRHLLEGSASALIVGALVGDVSGVSTLTVNAPILLSTLHYTRESEREADQYAFDLLSKSGRSPKDFADAMRRFEAMELCMAMRAKMRERDKNKTWKMGDPTDDDQSDNDEVSKPGDKSTPSKPLCTVDPEGFIKSQEGEGAELPSPQRETGYMHTHPVTRERIAAAEAAASK